MTDSTEIINTIRRIPSDRLVIRTPFDRVSRFNLIIQTQDKYQEKSGGLLVLLIEGIGSP